MPFNVARIRLPTPHYHAQQILNFLAKNLGKTSMSDFKNKSLAHTFLLALPLGQRLRINFKCAKQISSPLRVHT